MQQVTPLRYWPSGNGWTVGILDRLPSQLESVGIVFERDSDDLDSFRLAAIADEEIDQFWLFSRDHAPIQGTEVIVDAAMDRDTALDAVARQLGLQRDAYLWTSPDARLSDLVASAVGS